MAKFLPGHPKIPGSGRKKGQGKKAAGVPAMSTIREFLESQAWNPLAEIHTLMPKLSPYQQARINMELTAMAQKESLNPPGGASPGAGESDEAKRTATMTAAEFVDSLPVKLDESNGSAPQPGAD